MQCERDVRTRVPKVAVLVQRCEERNAPRCNCEASHGQPVQHTGSAPLHFWREHTLQVRRKREPRKRDEGRDRDVPHSKQRLRVPSANSRLRVLQLDLEPRVLDAAGDNNEEMYDRSVPIRKRGLLLGECWKHHGVFLGDESDVRHKRVRARHYWKQPILLWGERERHDISRVPCDARLHVLRHDKDVSVCRRSSAACKSAFAVSSFFEPTASSAPTIFSGRAT